MDSYWCKQQPGKPLFGDVSWSKPERRDQAGRLAIVGGNVRGFWAVAAAYQTARRVGVGEVRVIMPDSLRPKMPAAVRAQLESLILAPSNPSGGLALQAERDLEVAANWSNNILFIGDSGANSETAQLLEKFIGDNEFSDCNITITRDAVDLVVYGAETVLNRPKTSLVVSTAQLQKLAKAVYYPRVISFSQGVKQMSETLHKLTTTYPATIILFHDNNLLVGHDGEIISQVFSEPIRVWSGEIATRSAAWQIWQTDSVKAIATSWTEL